jgi:hypothetical protein
MGPDPAGFAVVCRLSRGLRKCMSLGPEGLPPGVYPAARIVYSKIQTNSCRKMGLRGRVQSQPMTNIPGWTSPLVDDGWIGDQQRFPTARQIVCWTDCPTCGAEKGHYCTDGRMDKKTGEMMDLAEWMRANDDAGAPAPSCSMRRQRGRSELKKKITAEKRRLNQIHKAVDKVSAAKAARKAGLPDSFSLF